MSTLEYSNVTVYKQFAIAVIWLNVKIPEILEFIIKNPVTVLAEKRFDNHLDLCRKIVVNISEVDLLIKSRTIFNGSSSRSNH